MEGAFLVEKGFRVGRYSNRDISCKGVQQSAAEERSYKLTWDIFSSLMYIIL